MTPENNVQQLAEKILTISRRSDTPLFHIKQELTAALEEAEKRVLINSEANWKEHVKAERTASYRDAIQIIESHAENQYMSHRAEYDELIAAVQRRAEELK